MPFAHVIGIQTDYPRRYARASLQHHIIVGAKDTAIAYLLAYILMICCTYINQQTKARTFVN